MFTPWPLVRILRRDIAFVRSLGVESFTSETQQNWANQGINFYVAAKLIADPAADVDALLKEYYTRFYGAAAGPMRRYWERFEAAMADSTAVGDGGYAWISMFRRPLLDASATDLAEAERLAVGDKRQIVRDRIAFARLGFDYAEAVIEMFEAHYRGDSVGLTEWSRKAVETSEQNDGHGAAGVLRLPGGRSDAISHVAPSIVCPPPGCCSDPTPIKGSRDPGL